MRKALFWLALALVLAVLIVRAAQWLQAPPRITRMLPECDAVVYANVKPLRAVTHIDRTTVNRAPEYQAFVDATGIVPERDLDAVALAIHRMVDPRGPNGPVAYSEVFQGRFDPARLEKYLGTLAASRESYVGKTIFIIPVGEASGRALRIAVIGSGLVIASNAPTPEQIHAMLNRGRSGPSLLAGYGDVPSFASAWGLGRLALPLAEDGWVTVAGLRLPMRDNTQFVVSARYLGGGVKLLVEELAGSSQNAARIVQELSPLLTLAHATIQTQAGLQSSAARGAVDSITLQTKGDRVVLTGVLPVEWLREMTAPPAIQAPR